MGSELHGNGLEKKRSEAVGETRVAIGFGLDGASWTDPFKFFIVFK